MFAEDLAEGDPTHAFRTQTPPSRLSTPAQESLNEDSRYQASLVDVIPNKKQGGRKEKRKQENKNKKREGKRALIDGWEDPGVAAFASVPLQHVPLPSPYAVQAEWEEDVEVADGEGQNFQTQGTPGENHKHISLSTTGFYPTTPHPALAKEEVALIDFGDDGEVPASGSASSAPDTQHLDGSSLPSSELLDWREDPAPKSPPSDSQQQVEEATTEPAPEGAVPVVEGPDPFGKWPNDLIICPFWVTEGQDCFRDKKCPYWHEEREGLPMERCICVHWWNGAPCPDEEACPYEHTWRVRHREKAWVLQEFRPRGGRSQKARAWRAKQKRQAGTEAFKPNERNPRAANKVRRSSNLKNVSTPDEELERHSPSSAVTASAAVDLQSTSSQSADEKLSDSSVSPSPQPALSSESDSSHTDSSQSPECPGSAAERIDSDQQAKQGSETAAAYPLSPKSCGEAIIRLPTPAKQGRGSSSELGMAGGRVSANQAHAEQAIGRL